MIEIAEEFNMYGHTCCPRCGEHFRYMRSGYGPVVSCDQCGFEEPATKENSNKYSAAARWFVYDE